jgi:hypothetical protein
MSGLSASLPGTPSALRKRPSVRSTFSEITSLLIAIVGPILGGIAGALASPGFTGALVRLAKTRAQRVEHVPATGVDLYSNGVPLTEAQFRDAFAAMQDELDQLSPPAERGEWELKRQYAAVNRFSVLAGTYPHAYPSLGNADDAWNWYKDNNPYATRNFPRSHGFILQPPGVILPPWQQTRGTQPS